ncbi:Phosphodiest-domain-containing protein [Meredithblackwellia eburnea MCA 4105]
MAPAKYSSLPSQSSPSLPLAPSDDGQAGINSADLSEEERGQREALDDEEDDTAEESGRDKEGLLSGVQKEEQDEGTVPLVQDRKAWLGRVQISIRTWLLLLLTFFVLLLIIALFHPSSALTAATKYYHSDSLKPGTFSSDGILADNPLPSGAGYADVPFASLGPAVSGVPKPGWAGGDDGNSLLEGGKTEGALWNGTHWWDRTVLLVSLDGVRRDYLDKGLTPHLIGAARKGLKAEYLKPVFPSLTFPNHYSLITGLYPSSHGIVANDFFDPQTGKEFVYTEPTKSWPPEWWGGEPIWSTAVKNGLRSAVLMWPGPPVMADGTKPTLWYAFQNKYHFSRKVDKIADWLDQPRATRPHLITAYAPEVDQEGHRSGPHSHKVEKTLSEMDDFAKSILEMLDQRNLTEIVDVLFVSDHGMTDTHNERLVFLDDILGEEGFAGIEHNEGWPSAGLRFQPHIDTNDMIKRLQAASESAKGGFKVYTPETMPERWHFSGHERIAPIYVVPHVGWAISDRHDFHVRMGGDYVPKGNHGYDNDDPSMHAIFVAHGPFANSIKASAIERRSPLPRDEEEITTIPGFANLEIYNLVASLLGIKEEGRAPTNGTVGFWEQYIA